MVVQREESSPILRPVSEAGPSQALGEGQWWKVPVQHQEENGVKERGLVGRKRGKRNYLEEIFWVWGALLHACEAGESAEQSRCEVAMLLRESPIAQQQRLRTQVIDNVDGFDGQAESLLEPL